MTPERLWPHCDTILFTLFANLFDASFVANKFPRIFFPFMRAILQATDISNVFEIYISEKCNDSLENFSKKFSTFFIFLFVYILDIWFLLHCKFKKKKYLTFGKVWQKFTSYNSLLFSKILIEEKWTTSQFHLFGSLKKIKLKFPSKINKFPYKILTVACFCWR